jgi:sulfur-carrier protein
LVDFIPGIENLNRPGVCLDAPHSSRRQDVQAMPKVFFTPQLRRFTETPELQCDASTLRQALEAAFSVNPRLRGYVLDDQGHVRPNVAIFIDGRRCADARAQSDALAPASQVHVLQALSGG